MPEASDEAHDWAMKKFGSIEDGVILKWLEERGYKEVQNGWLLFKPGITAFKDMELDEQRAVQFLVDEWDFGGIGAMEN